jgi:hypothetical protein
MEDVEQTIISQYANSPTLLQLIQNVNEYLDPAANFAAFYDFVWNVNTAVGFGLDIWGKIVGVSRLLTVPGSNPLFGFHDGAVVPDVQPFGQGVFNTPGQVNTTGVVLTDTAYRTLILAKALANISATTAPALNNILRNLFPGRGVCYVLDTWQAAVMTMQYTFRFSLTVTEFAILSQSGVLPRPAGVLASIVIIPTSIFVGFRESNNAVPMGFGPFYLPP